MAKQEVFSPLFIEFVQGKTKKDIQPIQPIQEKKQEHYVQTINGERVKQTEAYAIIKRGKMVGWGKF